MSLLKRYGQVLVVSAGLVACVVTCGGDSTTDPNDNESRGATLVGTVTLPSPAEGKTYAVAVDEDVRSDNGFVRVITGVCGAGTGVSYEIPEVASGTYFVYAVVWVVSPPLAVPASGDFVGFYGTVGGIPAEPNAFVPSSGRVTFDITAMVLP